MKCSSDLLIQSPCNWIACARFDTSAVENKIDTDVKKMTQNRFYSSEKQWFQQKVRTDWHVVPLLCDRKSLGATRAPQSISLPPHKSSLASPHLIYRDSQEFLLTRKMACQLFVLALMCVLVSVTQISGFRAIANKAVRQSGSSLYMAGFGAKKEVVDTGNTITRAADASAPCEIYISSY